MSRPARRPRIWLEGGSSLPAHEIVTPEGVPLRFEVGAAGDRFGAFVIDMVVISASVLLLALVASLASRGEAASWIMAFTILLFFFLRSFYFIFFELRWQGSTPGKRRLGLRVIDRSGGPLRGDAVFVRNLMREVEFFIPAQAILAPQLVWPGATGLFYFVVIAWLVVFALMPLFNRQRLRIGDMVAGTIVVTAPKALLLPDLSTSSPGRPRPGHPAQRFSTEQLEIYGIFELQVLEKLLRRDGPSDSESLSAVAETIKKKIGWTEAEGPIDPEAFLREFYAAQRARLEHKMLMGKRQEFKKSDR